MELRAKEQIVERRYNFIYKKKQLFRKREAWSNGRSSRKTSIVIENVVSQRFRYSSFFCVLQLKRAAPGRERCPFCCRGDGSLQSFQVKGRRIFFLCAAFLLHIALCQAKTEGCVNDPVVLVGGNPAVQFRIIRVWAVGSILTHKA